MSAARGRPRRLDYKRIGEELLKNATSFISKDGKILSKQDTIWVQMSDSLAQLGVTISPTALYSFFTSNRDQIRNQVGQALGVVISSSQPPPLLSTSSDADCTFEDSVVGEELAQFTFVINLEEFNDLLVSVKRKRNVKGAISYVNRYKFKPYEWEKIINEKIWYASRKKCGYNNKSSYVSATKSSGTFEGNCACGSKITCKFKQVDVEMVFSCVTTPGDGRCRKLFLRQSHRLKAGEKIALGNPDTFRSDLADKYLQDDDPACPLIPNAPVLRMAKSAYNHSKYWDKDPFIALTLMKATVYKEDIHYLTFKLFGVHYWTNTQRQAYNRYASAGHSCAFIDATGSIYPRFTKINGVKTRNSFLYVIVVNVDGEQFSVAQMVSEAHDTVVIRHFWEKWVQYGFIKPHEVVMDSSRALLTGTINALTGYATIESYADALWTDAPVNCYIRLDIAHFMAMYSRLLKRLPPLIKRFWLACVGKLVFIRNTTEMKALLQRIFIVGLFTRSGAIENKTELCLAQKHINFLRDLITDSSIVSLINSTLEGNEVDENNEENHSEDVQNNDEDINDYTLSEEVNSGSKNSWSGWGQEILQNVEKKLKGRSDNTGDIGNRKASSEDNGEDPNPYHCPYFVNRLVKDIGAIPLWSAITYHKFNYGRIPASSASVECEIKKIKNNLYKKNGKQRVDRAIELHINYLQGRMKLVNIAVSEMMPTREDESGDGGDVSGGKDHRSSDTSSEQVDQDRPHMEATSENSATIRNLKKDRLRTPVIKNKNREPLTEITETSLESETNNRTAISTSSETIHDISSTLLPVANSTVVTDDEQEEDHCSNRISSNCIACSRGDLPQGAHWCKVCKTPVHPFEKCSFPIENGEEGFNTARICFTCHSMPKAHVLEFVAKNHVENWGNLGKEKENIPTKHLPKKSQALYVGNNARLKEMLLFHKSTGLPVLRSGQSCGLQTVKFKDREISLLYTCPFDSLFQVLLSGACDYPAVSTYMNNTSHNEMFKFVINALQRPLTAYSYRRRAEILIPYSQISHKINSIEIMDCRMEIRSFAKKVFAFAPSWIEKSQCSQDCPERETFFPTISLNEKVLAEGSFINVFESWIFSQEDRTCCNEACNGKEMIVENIVGDLVVFEPYSENGEFVTQKLKNLPTEFNHPKDHGRMKLLGIIHFIPPVLRRRDDKDRLGHYVARSLRRDGKWVEYKDTVSSAKNLKGSAMCNVAFMLYAKV